MVTHELEFKSTQKWGLNINPILSLDLRFYRHFFPKQRLIVQHTSGWLLVQLNMYFVDWVGLVECRLGKNKTMVVQYTEYKANSSRNIPNSSDYQIEIEKKIVSFLCLRFQISNFPPSRLWCCSYSSKFIFQNFLLLEAHWELWRLTLDQTHKDTKLTEKAKCNNLEKRTSSGPLAKHIGEPWFLICST